MKIGILGGGLTGLTIASQLSSDYEIEVLEKEQTCGGLCRSLKDRGFTFDWGGAHILYSKDSQALKFALDKLGKNIIRFHRNNKIFFKNNLVKYPFENGLGELPLKDNLECLFHYLVRPRWLKPKNFNEWLYSNFGKGITEKYLIPYNEKIWGVKTENLDFGWVAGRIPQPPAIDILKSSLGFRTEGYEIQLNAFYPKTGGIFSLINSLEKKVPFIQKKFEVKKIRKQKNFWLVSNGKRTKVFNKLIATIPITDLVKIIDGTPRAVLKAAGLLRYNSLITVMIGIEGSNLPRVTAIYFAGKDFLPNRVAFPSNFSPYNVPQGKSSSIAEISVNKSTKIWSLPDKEIIKHVINGLNERGIINPKRICYTSLARIEYAYIVYDKNYEKSVKRIKSFIENLGIVLCGRFAEFEYLNMDACIRRGLEVVKSLKANSS